MNDADPQPRRFQLFVDRISRLLARIGRRWAVVRDGLAVLRPAWVAVVLTLVVVVALQNGQAVDAFESAVEKSIFSLQHLGLLAGILVVASAAWYFSRALFYVRYPRITPADSEARFETLRRWVPRGLGAASIVALSMTAFQARRPGLGVAYLLLAAVFLAVLIVRRAWLQPRGSKVELFEKMPRTTFLVSLAALAVAALFLGSFLTFRVDWPQGFGPLGILLFATAMWISFGSMLLVYPTYRFTLPSLVLVLIVVAGASSLVNDNHRVRTLADRPLADRPFLLTHLKGWLAARAEHWKARGGSDYPVFIVAAEGGGIRAAYWTASVLANLEKQYPGFACHLFAVSGVSGGSLGGAVFAAAIADRVAAGDYVCDGSEHRRDAAAGERLVAEVQATLGQDFLAPTLAGLLFPDATQRFFPVAFLPDRAAYLEEAWEAGWRKASGDDRFAEDFLGLWGDPERRRRGRRGRRVDADLRRYQVPSLFLNGTRVETGGRTVVSNLRPDDQTFVELDDLLDFLGEPIPLSTAVHMSARFTYVSPAGTLCRQGSVPCEGQRRVVDGGYFENSGGLTASEILVALRSYRAGALRPVPIALLITNSEEADGSVDYVFPDTLTPVVALLRTRPARGYEADGALRHLAGELMSQRFPLGGRNREADAAFPLGWSLATATQGEIEAKAEEQAKDLGGKYRAWIETRLETLVEPPPADADPTAEPAGG